MMCRHAQWKLHQCSQYEMSEVKECVYMHHLVEGVWVVLLVVVTVADDVVVSPNQKAQYASSVREVGKVLVQG